MRIQNPAFGFRIQIQNSVRIHNPNPESGFRIWIQNPNSETGFRIRIQNPVSESESGFRIQNSDSKSGFRIQIQMPKFGFRIRIQNTSADSESASRFWIFIWISMSINYPKIYTLEYRSARKLCLCIPTRDIYVVVDIEFQPILNRLADIEYSTFASRCWISKWVFKIG